MTGIEMIAKVRNEQKRADQSKDWDAKFFKTTNSHRIRALACAGAVIVEEIDRLLALEAQK